MLQYNVCRHIFNQEFALKICILNYIYIENLIFYRICTALFIFGKWCKHKHTQTYIPSDIGEKKASVLFLFSTQAKQIFVSLS